MISFTVKLEKGNVMIMTPESTKSQAVQVVIKDQKGNTIAYGYINKANLQSFTKAL